MANFKTFDMAAMSLFHHTKIIVGLAGLGSGFFFKFYFAM
jgi:hypothetical protein